MCVSSGRKSGCIRRDGAGRSTRRVLQSGEQFQNMLFGLAFPLRKGETWELLGGSLSALFLVPKEGKTFHLWRNRSVHVTAIKNVETNYVADICSAGGEIQLSNKLLI